MSRGEKRAFLVGECVLRLRLTRRREAEARLDGDRRTLAPADRERAAWLARAHLGCGTHDLWYDLLFPPAPEAPCSAPCCS